ncbi:unnamed protein product [Rhizophagus irregularis]|nr:unnamed protein product [Rhizophagus irregularis]
METYPGQDVLISYLRKQGSLTYREFLELYRDDIITSIITSLSSYPSWNELDYTWAFNYLREAERISTDQDTFRIVKEKVDAERLQHKKIIQEYWEKVIEEYNKENPKPDATSSKSEINIFCYDILCELKNTIFYQPFCTYAENLNSDYFKKINYPMDLFIVNSKLENNQYSSRSLECIFNEKFKKFKNQTKQKQRSRKQDNDDDMDDLSIEITDDVLLFASAYNSLISGDIERFNEILKKKLSTRSQMSLSSANEPVLQEIFEFSLPSKYRVPELCLVMNKNVRKGNGRFGFVDMFVLGDETNVIIELKYIQLAGLLRDINEKQTKTFSSIELSKLDKIIEKEDEKSLLERKYVHYVKNMKKYKQTTIEEILKNGTNQLLRYINIIIKGKATKDSAGICDERIEVMNSNSHKLIGFIIVVIGSRRIIGRCVNEISFNYKFKIK